MPTANQISPEENQRQLLGEIKSLSQRLREQAGLTAESPRGEKISPRPATKSRRRVAVDDPAQPKTATQLDKLTARFGLSPFERATLLLCAGVELDASFAALCRELQQGKIGICFGFALAVLPGATWQAVTPAGILRKWRMVEIESTAGLTQSPLRLDERILHYLTGISYHDPRLRGLVSPVGKIAELSPGHRRPAQDMVDAIAAAQTLGTVPIFDLRGSARAARLQVAGIVARTCDLGLWQIRGRDLPSHPEERAELATIWEREAALTDAGLFLSAAEEDSAEISQRAESFVEQLRGIVFYSGRTPLHTRLRQVHALMIDPPTAEEQIALWSKALGAQAASLNGQVAKVAAQFSLDAAGIREAARDFSARPPEEKKQAGVALWDAARTQARISLQELAQQLEPNAKWSDLILPTAQLQTLRTIVAQVRQRRQVCDTWGFAKKSSRGLGLSTLFFGPSGTGKTMAAEVLARELALDLFRVDLSGMVSKYIGETEKNLKKVFDAADESGAILLFDEADALFGKRSEVRDSHDRYANIEVSYLLQRVEAYRGLAILTTNMKQALDSAFMRRLRFVVPFPFPDTEQRKEIWRQVFPPETPIENLDYAQLAKLSLAGGHIRNVAINAAFLAAEAGERVGMRHLQQAAQSEYAKLEKNSNDTEMRQWK